MLEVCEGCDWTHMVWCSVCSVRGRLVSKGLIPPCLPEHTCGEHTCGECEFYTHFMCRNAPGYLSGWKFTKPDTKACKRFVVSPPEPGGADATIRKLRARIKHLSGEMNRLVGLLDAYADCPSYDDARQLVYNLRKKLAEAKAEIAGLYKDAVEDGEAWEQECKEAEHQLAEAKAEIERQAKYFDRRLNRLCVENGQLQISLTKAKAETEKLRPLAENWQLVLGMRQHSSLRCIAPTIGYVPGYYSARTHLFGGSHTVFTSGSPAEALRAIQASEEEK